MYLAHFRSSLIFFIRGIWPKQNCVQKYLHNEIINVIKHLTFLLRLHFPCSIWLPLVVIQGVLKVSPEPDHCRIRTM